MVSYEDYDTPLYEQIVQRIGEDIAERIGTGRLTRDRYFIIPFAYQKSAGNDPLFSHSFITAVRVLPEGTRYMAGSEHAVEDFKYWNFESFTVSWLPADFAENPDLCVFRGFGARLFPRLNRCPLVLGKSFSLKETIKFAADARVAVCMWGAYEIAKPAFDLGVAREHLLDTGRIKYRADDRLYRKSQVAINCFRAMSNLDEPFPQGGAFGTGFRMWGFKGTARVLIEYTTRTNRRHLLLEPVDIQRDRYGFVYAPQCDSPRGTYNPFKSASAYRH